MAGFIFDNSNSDISAETGLVTVNGSPIASTLDGLGDVVITGVTDNEVLAYNTGTSQWINQTADEAGLVDIAGTQSITGAKTFTANTVWTDDDQVRLGTGGDLRLYHDGSDSYIENTTGGFAITTALGNLNLAATAGSVNIDANGGVDIDAPNGLFVDNNIEINGAGWGIFPNRVGVGTVPSVAEAAGAALQVVGNSYVSADLNLGGAIGIINAGGTVENVISASGADGSQYTRIRNFLSDATLWEVRSRSGTVGTADREATLALTRTDESGNEEFLDLFNNGYASLSEKISEAYGIRMQKRGTGVYRPFYLDWYDGTTVTDGLDVLSPDDSGGPLFTFQQRLVTSASSSSRAGFNAPHGTAPSSPVNGDVWTTTAGIFVRVNGVTVGPLSAGGSAQAIVTDTTVVNFNTSSPVTLFTTPANTMIKEVIVIVDTAFNDAAATLSVGVNGGSNSKYMTTGSNDLDAAATSVFTFVNGNPAASAEALEAYLTPGSASQGSVRVIVVHYVEG